MEKRQRLQLLSWVKYIVQWKMSLIAALVFIIIIISQAFFLLISILFYNITSPFRLMASLLSSSFFLYWVFTSSFVLPSFSRLPFLEAFEYQRFGPHTHTHTCARVYSNVDMIEERERGFSAWFDWFSELGICKKVRFLYLQKRDWNKKL